MRGAAHGSGGQPVWTLTKGALSAACVIRRHPQGEEVLITLGGVRLYAKIHRDASEALHECAVMRERMVGRGWVQPSENPQPAPHEPDGSSPLSARVGDP